MRLTLIVALVSCVFLTTERTEARPADAAQKTQKAQKRKRTPDAQPRAVAKAKAPAKSAKAESSRKPKSKVAREDEAVIRDDDDEPTTHKTASKKSPAPKSPVAQANDDEVPRNEKPAKKTR